MTSIITAAGRHGKVLGAPSKVPLQALCITSGTGGSRGEVGRKVPSMWP